MGLLRNSQSESATAATFVPAALAIATFGVLGVGVAHSAGWISELFTTAPNVIVASRGYFQAVGLVYGFMAASVTLVSACQGWGKRYCHFWLACFASACSCSAVGTCFSRGSRWLERRYVLIADSTALSAVVLRSAFVFRPPVRTGRQV